MRIGIHSELHNSRYPVLHAEMRRRLWYSLIFFDARISELAMYKNTCLTPTWDCKAPLNINDHDLRAGMREPPVAQSKTSEALFVVVRSEIANFVRHASFYLEFTTPALKAVAREVAEEKQVADFAKSMERDYFDHCDPGNPLHYLSIWSTRSFLSRSLLQEHYAACSSGAKTTSKQANDALSHAIHMIDCDTQLHNTALVKGFRWFFRYQFPAIGYFHIIEVLKKDPTDSVAKRAWDVMSENYEARHAAGDHTDLNGPFVRHFTKLILELWDSTQATAQDGGKHNPEPRIVELMSSKAAGLGLPGGPGGVTGVGETEDTMSTYMDEFMWSMSAGYPPQDCTSGLGLPGSIGGMVSSLQEQVSNPIGADLQTPASAPWMAGGYW
ncbi:putative transcriptional regulatory protein [Emericellopsis cladophorae]|uniref:Transcriptional regulatory protein n=1 Tax=Emericellopsis cladophorae TaxID=2686198 RepID=A0A9P9XWP6_9HYPO|nr:putative transcriptional regulatory protein [Emericellopsis cladophorae]KAI6779248.1 putative transcriptional regulatory protein [Emericellopsis cladophorae]